LPGAAPHVRQANPADGRPSQFAHRVVSCRAETPKVAARRSISVPVKPRCRPSAAHTVEALCQPISSPSFA